LEELLKKVDKSLFLFFLLIVLLLLAACAGQESVEEDAIASEVAATQTRAAWEADLDSTWQPQYGNPGVSLEYGFPG
jgi:outer membrane biogenesis lipoprotein LolB